MLDYFLYARALFYTIYIYTRNNKNVTAWWWDFMRLCLCVCVSVAACVLYKLLPFAEAEWRDMAEAAPELQPRTARAN